MFSAETAITSDGSTGSDTLLSRTSKSKLVARESTSTTVTGSIWNELTQTSGKQAGYASMVGNVDRLYRPVGASSAGSTGTDPRSVNDQGVMPQTTLFIPLQFWFCRNPGLALPLIALQYHEVKINIEFRSAADCCGVNSTVPDSAKSLTSASLYVDYIYLDTDERRRFAQVSHEYLIEQLQFTGDESVTSTNNKIKLNFNHPCKELVWVVQMDACVNSQAVDGANVNGKQWFNYTDAVDTTPYGQADPLALADIMDGVIDTTPQGGVTAHGSLHFGSAR